MDLLFKIKKAIGAGELIHPGDHLLVAVSGGIDSMTLLYLLDNIKDDIGFLISVVHVNHRLRGGESDGDEAFVEEYCGERGLPFYSKKWCGAGKGENTQDAARKFRFETFYNVAQKICATKIAIAHNLNDQVETILLNMIRGSGLDGLCGMQMMKRVRGNAEAGTPGITLIRPLLGSSRQEIESFAKGSKIPFRNDSTNDQTKYTRNFLRHKVMPLIREINPAMDSAIAKMAGLLEDDEDYLEAVARDNYDLLVIESGADEIALDGSRFCKLAHPIRTRILKLAYVNAAGTNAGIGRDHLLKMDGVAADSKPEGSYNLPHSLVFKRDGARLAICRK